MASALSYVLTILGVLIVASVVLFYKFWFQYWKKVGLEYIEPSIPFGNTRKLFTQQLSYGLQFAEFYKNFKKRNLKHGGVYVFARPFYVPVDQEIIKNIMVRDFQSFYDRGFFVNEKIDPLSAHLFTLEGAKWKNMRNKLTATFTSGKMKMMFNTMANTAIELHNIVDKAATTNEPLEIKEILTRFTTDVISSCAFGLETNSLRNPDAEFRYYGQRSFGNTTWENLNHLLQFVFPRKMLSFFNYKTSKSDIEKFMFKLVAKTVGYREKENIYRKDFLHLLIQLKNRGRVVDDKKLFDDDNKNVVGELTQQELTAQVFVFFIAAFESSSTVMTFALYHLACSEEMQDKVRAEINKCLTKYNKLCYEALMEMTYLDKIINETLRMYPPLPFINRVCTIDYPVVGTDIVLEKGTMVVIPMLGVHYDAEFYPNPQHFDPERFDEKEKKNRPSTSFIPFGDGPRNCIGIRFGIMQTKIGLITFLQKYKISLNKKTVQPFRIETKTITTNTKDGIYLNVSNIEN